MGIVNVTPDSFSDGGSYLSIEDAVNHALKLVEAGADILDIGGESTRPGSSPVPLEVELDRTIPVIAELAKRTAVPLSIDTTKAEVARQAIENGAVIVNDISGLRFDPQMVPVCRDTRIGVVCMHIQGTPQTMQDNPTYTNVTRHICEYFEDRLSNLEEAGIDRERVLLDPGVGFGKTAQHNVEIMTHVAEFRRLGRPVLIGHSRKRFLKAILGRPVEERLSGTVGVSVALAEQHTDILRVHDIQAVRDAITAWSVLHREITN
ncbi:MAG: dihydropteroate synthase [Planctomycetaceae bacterium]|nr:dihydropteroate synthase [Planctomycetaceae bacterium]